MGEEWPAKKALEEEDSKKDVEDQVYDGKTVSRDVWREKNWNSKTYKLCHEPKGVAKNCEYLWVGKWSDYFLNHTMLPDG